MEKRKNKLIKILIGAGVFFLLIGGLALLRSGMQNRENEQIIEALRPTVESSPLPEDSSEEADIPSTETETTTPTEETLPGTDSTDFDASVAGNTEVQLTEHPYRESFLANEDMVAWLQIPGTEIDYPVMWTPRDENFYLYRDFEGNENQNGCLILDTDSCLDPLTTNLIIHGHNMRSGSMFGNLTDYEDEEYLKAHPEIYLYTPTCKRTYQVIAVFRSQVYKKSDTVFKFYQFFQADTQEEFDDFYENIKEMSIHDTGVTAQFGDRFITLSTCVYHVDRGRFVVVAKEAESDEAYLPLTN